MKRTMTQYTQTQPKIKTNEIKKQSPQKAGHQGSNRATLTRKVWKIYISSLNVLKLKTKTVNKKNRKSKFNEPKFKCKNLRLRTS